MAIISSTIGVGVLAFSLGLNIILVGMSASHKPLGSRSVLQSAAAMQLAKPVTHTLQFDDKQLHLSEQQQQRFREILNRYLDEEKKAKTEGVERIQRISRLLIRNDATTTTFQPVFREIRDHSDDFFVRLTRVVQEYRSVLTPEQQEIFNKMLEDRLGGLQRLSRQRSSEYEQRLSQSMQRHQGVPDGS